MAAFKDRAGVRYGSLVAVEFTGNKVLPSGKQKALWRCRCDCSGETVAIGDNLQSGNTVSCGCVRRATSWKNRSTHGHATLGKSPEWRCWRAMRERCLNPKGKDFHKYGGRGIRICDRWTDFALFLADMGERPSAIHTLDREDPNGHYEPGNVRWATPKQQARNRRNHRLVEYDGRTMPASEAAELAGLPDYVVLCRLNRGTPPFAPYTPRPRRSGVAL